MAFSGLRSFAAHISFMQLAKDIRSVKPFVTYPKRCGAYGRTRNSELI